MILSVLIATLAICHGANILGLFHHPGASHTRLGKVLLKNLALRGHQVTMISAFPMETPISNYRDIHLKGLLEDLHSREKMYFNRTSSGILEDLRNMTLQHLDDTLSNPEVKQLLNSNQTFDVIIQDYFYNEASLIFSHVFKAPTILMSSFGNNFLLNPLTGNTLPFSYVPGGGFPISDDMSFKYRMLMTLLNLLIRPMIKHGQKRHMEILNKHFSNPPTIEELDKNVALVLSNSHFSIESVRPFTPNIIPIAGLHVEEPEELSKDLKIFLDTANEGVVLFSLGSQIKSSNLDETLLRHLLNAFSRLPQKIMWKFESEFVGDLPSNVKILKWMPQLGVLAHPNVKLFLSHGGVSSFIEALYSEVPLICMSFLGDQVTNGAFIESRHLGRHVQVDEITGDVLYGIMQDVINNPKYLTNVKYYSSLLREQPIKPLDSAIFWVEHVIKHKGAPHLRPFSLKLPWYKYYMIDVIAFLGAILLTTIILFFCIIRKVSCVIIQICRKTSKEKIS